ncbi:MAG: YeeE/YedE family protein [Oleiphilaceae bacterium]|nr:YeeE/YedE family protein [Oleiphilaceae bacterium]
MITKNQSAQVLLAFGAGILFAIGLIVSQMVNPAKVLNFLDIAGAWDPTLAFVMGGAILVTMPAFRFVLKRPHPLFGSKFYLPTRSDIDARLVAGAVLFGIGWGITGLCPGPAITALASGLLPVVGFLLAMTGGVLVHKWLVERP